MIFSDEFYNFMQKERIESSEFFLEDFGDYNHAAFIALWRDLDASFACGLDRDFRSISSIVSSVTYICTQAGFLVYDSINIVTKRFMESHCALAFASNSFFRAVGIRVRSWEVIRKSKMIYDEYISFWYHCKFLQFDMGRCEIKFLNEKDGAFLHKKKHTKWNLDYIMFPIDLKWIIWNNDAEFCIYLFHRLNYLTISLTSRSNFNNYRLIM